MADKVNAILKVYYLFNDTKCLARGGTISATPVAPGADVATIDLRSCALAVCSSSPELIGDKTVDYSIYTLDATEGPEGDLYEGQGLLSWGLSQPARLAKIVSGFIKPSLSGNILEVRMKLSQVVQSSQQEFITSMQSFERISRTLPATFDYSNWTEFMKHASPGSQVHATQPITQTVPKPSLRTASSGQINTLQRARELAARQNTSNGMSAQLKTARQQQSSQQRHARIIAQQAAATQAKSDNINYGPKANDTQQRRSDSQEGDGPLPESPQEPAASSPPQMKIFAPPPASTVRSNSMPTNTLPDSGYALPPLAKFTSTGTETPPEILYARGTKRKASELNSSGNGPARTKEFSPSKAVNAAKNNVGAIQQLFKPHSAGGTTSINSGPTVLERLQNARDANARQTSLTPAAIASGKVEPIKSPFIPARAAQPASQRTDADLLKALEDGQPIKFCYNCGSIHTRGNWRQLNLNGGKHSLCNACGVYWKTKGKMRPEKLWDRHKQDPMKMGFPARSGSITKQLAPSRHIAAPLNSDVGHPSDVSSVVQTSPVKGNDHQNFQQLARATRSSPLQSTHMTAGLNLKDIPRSHEVNRPSTPVRGKLHELQVNTPQLPPSPSPASGNGLEDLVALLQTPKKSFSAKALSSPSPWRSMFTLLDDVQKDGPDSPSRHKLDKFLEDLGMSNATGGMNFDFSAIANFPLSPAAQDNLDSLASFMSSPPGMGIFTSSTGLENDNSTPEDIDLPLSAQKKLLQTDKVTPKKDSGAQELYQHFEESDSLFTPKKYNTRSRPGSVQRGLRSAGVTFGENMFGGELK